MLRNVFLKTLRDQFRPILFWSLGFIALILIYIALWPSIQESAAELQAYIEKLPEAFRSAFATGEYATPVGYINSELFSFMAPLFFMIFTVTFASGTLLNEEASGTMNILLSSPLPRWKLVLEKWSAMVIATLIIAFIAWEGFFIGLLFVEMDLNLANIVLALFSAALLALVFGTFSLFLASLTPSRGLAVGVTSVLVVASYLLNVLGPVVGQLKDFQRYSLFYFYNQNNIIQNGLNLTHAGILVFLTLIFLGLSIAAFSRRDVGR
ncbi:MAG: ABC transporter permease subunit [bacterium]|nr:ABC transporter permease subunit [bacterium]